MDLGGRTILVTGANSGLGYETAKGLMQRGATVGMLCRSRERGERALEELRGATGETTSFVVPMDLARFASIREGIAALPEGALHGLVHNAGLLPEEREESAEGYELTFAVHVIGPYLLTRALEDRLRRVGDPGRVVWVSSGGMYFKRLSVEDLDWTRRRYDGVAAYAQTKRQQVVLAEELAGRAPREEWVVHSTHPGWADTPGVQSSIPGFHKLTRKILRTPAEGADTTVWLAAAQQPLESTGEFWFDRQPRSPYMLPNTRESRSDRDALLERCEAAWTRFTAES